MPRSIMVAIDGTESSQSAVALGLRWAAEFDCLLVGLGVVDETAVRRPEPTPLGGGHFKQQQDEAQLAAAVKQCEKLLDQFAVRCAEAGVASKLLEVVGDPSELILLEAQRYDLMLVGSDVKFAFGTLASVPHTIEALVKHAPRPVVCVPRILTPASDILVAYDSSLQSARALQSLVATGLAGKRTVHVTSAAADTLEAARHCDRAIEYLRSHDIPTQAHPVKVNKDVAQAVFDVARQVQAGLIVMGAYGRGRLVEFFFGSITRHMLAQDQFPLLLHH